MSGHIRAAETAQTVATFDKHAKAYRDAFVLLPSYLATFDALADRMQPGHTRVLDLACGPGTLSLHLKSHFPGLEITATDLSPQMLMLAKEALPDGEFHCVDLRDTASLAGEFDVIACAFGLPYLDSHSATQFLRDCTAKLAPGGLLYLSFIECDTTPHSQTNRHGDSVWRQGHCPADLVAQLSALGLEPVWQQSTETRGETEHFLIAVKNSEGRCE